MCNTKEALIIRDEAYMLSLSVFKNKISDCYLYGSYARGDFNKESDVDIMLIVDMSYSELNAIRYRISQISSSLSLKYNVTVSIKLQPKEIIDTYKDIVPFYQSVLREGIRYGH